MSFDPNTNYSGMWATHIPNRQPKFKTYTNKGHATSSLKAKRIWIDTHKYQVVEGCQLYRHNGIEWVEIMFNPVFKHGEPLKLFGEHECKSE